MNYLQKLSSELNLKYTLLLLFPVFQKITDARSMSPDRFRNITVMVGQTVFFTCELENDGNETIIWIREKDSKLISTDFEVFTSNERFTSIRDEYSGKLTLRIKDVQVLDSGVYQCYIDSSSSIRAYVQLNVNRPILKLMGTSNEIYIHFGKSVNFSCIIESDLNQTNGITWFHNEREIHTTRHILEWMEVQPNRKLTIATLLIHKAMHTDEGKYTCVAANNVTQQIILHVSTGKRSKGNLATMHNFCWFFIGFVVVYEGGCIASSVILLTFLPLLLSPGN